MVSLTSLRITLAFLFTAAKSNSTFTHHIIYSGQLTVLQALALVARYIHTYMKYILFSLVPFRHVGNIPLVFTHPQLCKSLKYLNFNSSFQYVGIVPLHCLTSRVSFKTFSLILKCFQHVGKESRCLNSINNRNLFPTCQK